LLKNWVGEVIYKKRSKAKSVWFLHPSPFVLLILGCVFESYGYFVITKLAKGNIIPASIWHFSGNLFVNANTKKA